MEIERTPSGKYSWKCLGHTGISDTIQAAIAACQKIQDEELIDTLIAISVVAKRLAKKLSQKTKEENPSEQD